MGHTPLLRLFRSVGWSGIFLKCPGCNGGKRFGNFYPLIDENQRGLTVGENSGPNHDGLWILSMLDDSGGAGSLGSPAPVVQMIMGLFDGE